MPKGEYLQYGGQAVIEGVMMRSPNYFAVAVRAPNDQIILQTEKLAKSWIGRQMWLKKPFLRGSLAILDAMALGTRAMGFAAKVQMDERFLAPEVEDGATSTPVSREPVLLSPTDALFQKTGSTETTSGIGNGAVGGAMAVGIAFALFLFVFLPNALGESLKGYIKSPFMLNVVSGVFKFIIFFAYIWLVSRLKEIKRVFQYHGAEHKAINVMEADENLELKNCKTQTRLHPRCGTSFAIIVLVIDFVVLPFVPRYLLGQDASTFLNLLARFGANLMILPFIAGIAYELLRLAGKFRDTRLVNILFWPGLMTQYITTAEPDDSQIEVAIAALNAVVEAEAAHQAA